MNYYNLAVAWVKDRLAERTSWDGGALIVISLLIIIASPIVKLAAWAGLAYVIYTLVTEEFNK